ncbi:MAG: heat-inducible transcriptional repressor HrcA [Gemmatimonadales bacterium]|nr:heat-inducible transcriptional repressor HrcA [Gemmatimonadales bacterium]
MAPESLTDRELRVLEAVIQMYVETAEPAGSQSVARRYGLGVSSATVRAVMAELEEKGLLFHPHTSAGRIPTDRGYRLYVDGLMRLQPPSDHHRETIRSELGQSRTAIAEVLHRAAQVLGVLTEELGVAVAPALDDIVLERLAIVPVASERLLLVLELRSGMVRTIYVQIPHATIAAPTLDEVARVLNERLAGRPLREIRETLPERLRDASDDGGARELLNIFVTEGDELFAVERGDEAGVVLSGAGRLAEQPEFTDAARMRELLAITERRDLLRQSLHARREQGLRITIGGEHGDPRLAGFTLVTSSYQVGELRGVIGVMGPTRMPYDKVIGLVDHTSRLVEGLLQ